MKEQLLEIAGNYDISGFFIDIVYFQPEGCFCEYCRRLFLVRYGREIPSEMIPGSIELKQWLGFRRESKFNFLRYISESVKSCNPDLCITWNGSANHTLADMEADEYADYLTSEMHPPAYLEASLKTKWARTRGKPFELSMPFEMGSWGDWTIAPETTLKALAATAVSNGCAVNLNHVVYPSGFQAGGMNSAMVKTNRSILRWIEEIEPWLLGAESVPYAAVLYGIDNKRMLEASGLPGASKKFNSINGINRIMIEGNIHFDIISEDTLKNRLNQYKLLIVPDQAYISGDNQKLIREFVSNGGRLIATNRTSLYNENGVRNTDFGLSDVFGAHFIEVSPYSIGYIYGMAGDIGMDIPDMPVLVGGTEERPVRVVKNGGAKILGWWIDPAVEAKAFRHVYHQHAHPAHVTRFPAIVHNKFGKGECVFVPGPLESSFWVKGSPWLRNILLNCIKILVPDPLLNVDAPVGIEVSLMKQETRWMLHLINIRDVKAAGSRGYIEDVIPVYDIKVRAGVQPSRVYLAPEMEDIPFAIIEDGIEFVIPQVDLHRLVVFDGVNMS